MPFAKALPGATPPPLRMLTVSTPIVRTLTILELMISTLTISTLRTPPQ